MAYEGRDEKIIRD